MSDIESLLPVLVKVLQLMMVQQDRTREDLNEIKLEMEIFEKERNKSHEEV